jgi:hypothetical protein
MDTNLARKKSTAKPLLSFDSPTYLRRMARELNGLSDGFYHNGERYSRARFTAGQLVLVGQTFEWNHNKRRTVWFSNLVNVVISDAYGRTVCASRKA